MLSRGHILQTQRYKLVENKRMEKVLSCKQQPKKVGVAILTSNKINFRIKNLLYQR